MQKLGITSLFLAVGLALFGASFAFAGQPLVAEAPIKACTDPTQVSISTSAWTQVPSGGNCAGRTGLFLNVISTASARMCGIITNSSSAPSVSIGLCPIEIAPASDSAFIGISDGSYLWLRSKHTSAEAAEQQEVKQ